MSNKAFRVSEEWLEKVDKVVDKPKEVVADPHALASRFYDVRPAVQTSSTWTKVGETWRASFAFLVNDVVDNSFVFPAFAVTSSTQPTTGEGTRVFVVWRGRWEIVGGGSGGGTAVTANYYHVPLAGNYLSATTAGKMTVVTSVTASNNHLIFNTATLNARAAALHTFVIGIQ